MKQKLNIMKILTSIPFLSILLIFSLAGMETTPVDELKGFLFATLNLIILSMILLKAIVSKKSMPKKEDDNREAILANMKNNFVGTSEDGTEYYLIKMKGNTPVKA